jgi:hypothetical protein
VTCNVVFFTAFDQLIQSISADHKNGLGAYGRSGLGPIGPKPAKGICKRIRYAVEPFAGVRRSRYRACDGVAKRHGRRAAGA